MSETNESTAVDPSQTITGVIHDAKQQGKVIRCIPAQGGYEIHAVSAGDILPGKWIYGQTGLDDAHIADETRVRNAVRRCWPDVYLIDEKDSEVFGDA